MPAKGGESNKSSNHNKANAKIKKPVIQSPNNLKGRLNSKNGARVNSRLGIRGKGSIVEDDEANTELNNSLNPTSSGVQKENLWYNQLPPVIKPDEELHIKLLKERKGKEEKKHYDFCNSELRAILNIALTEVDLPPSNREKFITKTKADFFNGVYHDPEVNLPNSPKSNNQSNLNGSLGKEYDFFQLKQSVQHLIESDSVSVDDAFNSLSLTNDSEKPEFDINKELNGVFADVTKSMQQYVDQDAPKQIASFPFLICVVGPPCSGKSTICQFITSHFDVKIINVINPDYSSPNAKANMNSSLTSSLSLSTSASNATSKACLNVSSNIEAAVDNENSVSITSADDKVIINSIIAEISDLPQNKGVVIANFPETKSQLIQLEKALQANLKKKGDGVFGSISGLIRTSMTPEEAARQVQNRLIDRNTGFIYHSIFNPPDFSSDSKFTTEPFPYQFYPNLNSTRNIAKNKNNTNNNSLTTLVETNVGNNPIMDTYTELAAIYAKLNPQYATFENLMKKIGPFVSIGFCSFIGQLHQQIESFLKSIYKLKNIEPPFTTFVVFENQDQFYYSKLCHDVFQMWFKECVPQFGKQIGSLYNRLTYSRSKINYLLDISIQMFSLIISKQDDRKEKTNEFIKTQNKIRNNIKHFHLIKAEKESKKRMKQLTQSTSNKDKALIARRRANTSIVFRSKNVLKASAIKQKTPIMTIKTRNLYLRNVFPNINIDDLDSIKSLESPISLTIKTNQKPKQNKNNKRPLTAISDLHKNLNLNSIFDKDLNQIDTDKEIEKEEKKLSELQINFYHFIWQQSIELRTRNTKAVDDFAKRSPIKALKNIMEENVKITLDALLKRFFLVDWFSTYMIPLLKKKGTEENRQDSNVKSSSPKTNVRQGSKVNLLSESALMDFNSNANKSEYNITELPHPKIPEYDITNLKELCSLMHVEYKENEDSCDSNLRAIKSNIINQKCANDSTTNEEPPSENADVLSDPNNFSYLMTPTNRMDNCSKTPTGVNNVWDVEAKPSKEVAATSRNSSFPVKKKIRFPPKISFDNSNSPLYSMINSGRISSRTAVSNGSVPMGSILANSEKAETVDEEPEIDYYSDSGYYGQTEEEEEEKAENKNDAPQPQFPFHFPEWRKCNKANRKDDSVNILSESSSGAVSAKNVKSKSKGKSKAKPIIVNEPKQEPENNINVQASSRTCRSHHHHMSKEEAIRNFLSYLQTELDDNMLKSETDVMQSFFTHFLDEKAIGDSQIDSELEKLKENLKKMIHQKCAKEMETFSQRFRAYKDKVDEEIKNLHKFNDQSNPNPEVNQPQEKSENELNLDINNLTSDILFPFDTSYMTERCIEIFNELDFNIKEASPADGENEYVDAQKMQKLYTYYYAKYNESIRNQNNENPLSIEADSEKKTQNDQVEKVEEKQVKNERNEDEDENDIIYDPDYFVSLEDLSAAMDSLQFSEKEKMFVEANVRMKIIPEFINIFSFIRSFLPIDFNLSKELPVQADKSNTETDSPIISQPSLLEQVNNDDANAAVSTSV